MITGAHPNQLMFVRFLLTYITKEGSQPEIIRHWGSITFTEGDMWWFGHETMQSNPTTVWQENLARLLFTKAGRITLSVVVQADFQGQATVYYDGNMFLDMPRIQFRGLH